MSDETAKPKTDLTAFKAALASERTLHPNGRCGCFGEGRCQWCQMNEAKIERDELLEACQLVDEAFDLDDLAAFTEAQQQAIGAVTNAIARARGSR